MKSSHKEMKEKGRKKEEENGSMEMKKTQRLECAVKMKKKKERKQ